MGPYQVIRQTEGGSYILAEMDGSLLRHYVAAFRLIPYIQRQELGFWADQMDVDVPEENEVSEYEETEDSLEKSQESLNESS